MTEGLESLKRAALIYRFLSLSFPYLPSHMTTPYDKKETLFWNDGGHEDLENNLP